MSNRVRSPSAVVNHALESHLYSRSVLNYLPQILRDRALYEPDGIAYRFFNGKSLTPEELSYGDLYNAVSELGLMLKNRGLYRCRALIGCKSHRNFIVAFYACMISGIIAVPVPAPRRKSLADRLQFIAEDSEAGICLFDCDELSDARFVVDGGVIECFDLRMQVPATMRPLPLYECSDEVPAFLQYTSGSTGKPKGVVVSHGNLIYNCFAMQKSFDITRDSSILVALPLFHDMGLIGGVLQALYSGCVGNFLSPYEFIQYPERWLQIISRYRITISGGPNFMFDLAARSPEISVDSGIDLSSWAVAFCGAEPIRPSTIAQFSERFASVGFRPESFVACYGMAEATLLVASGQTRAGPQLDWRNGRQVVCCGNAAEDMEIRIVCPETLEVLPDGADGEIWVRGKSVARGYWNREQTNENVFRAVPLGHTQAFLRTGDIGYVKEEKLYVSGRLKDIIISNGKKFSPHDLEMEAESCHPGVRSNGAIAFSVLHEEDEQLVIVLELKRDWLRKEADWMAIASAVKTVVNKTFGIAVRHVVIIKPGSLPRTSSGKSMRSRCRQDYCNGKLDMCKSL